MGASTTAIYPIEQNIEYVSMGLANEVGEVLGKIKKAIRDDIDIQTLRDQVKDELGDVLWYAAMLAFEFGLNLSEVANHNHQKLLDRKERQVIQGSGDNR